MLFRSWRVRGHVSVDVQGYRDPADLKGALDADPLIKARAHALASGIREAELDAIDQSAHEQAQEAVAYAHASPWPDLEAAYTDVLTLGAGTWR